jgi:hypothetical protein
MANTEKGHTGLIVYNGVIQEEFLKDLRGKEGYKRYQEMRLNSPVIGSMLLYHEQAIRKVSWNFVNKDNRKAQDERVDFLNKCREYMSQSWNDFISEVLTFIPFGWSAFWVNYKKYDDGSWGWDTFSPRKQNTVYRWLLNYPNQPDYDPDKRNGEIMGFIQQAPPIYTLETLPIERLIHFRTKVEANNPEGISMLRNAWTSYYYWKNYHALEGIGFERDLTGMPVIKMPQNASSDTDDPDSDASKAAEVVRNLRNDEQSGLVLPFGWDAMLLSGAGKGFDAIGRALERLESRQLMAMLSQFIMLGQNGVGSLALSGDQTDTATMIVDATADIIAETFTKQEIPRILKLNGYPPDDLALEHTPAGDKDVVALADFLQKAGEKITWSAQDELWLRQTGGLPERTVEEIEQAQAEKRANAPVFSLPNQPARQPLLEDTQDIVDAEPVEQNRVALFGVGDPIDKRKRERAERQWNDAMALFLVRQKRRVMKAARAMKGVS